ncbi:MAG: hypothetical protein Q7N95_17350, partial [Alphaproteobacteria bacterium]|nr:hypothetical protein [Alphaproteobacteria bacterium]
MEDWQLILLTAVATTFGTVLVTFVGHRMTVSKDSEAERERHARYLAIRVVCVLDPFVSECCNIAQDSGMPDHEGTYHPRFDDPVISFPDDVDWRSITPNLMYRILGFRNEIDVAQQSIAFVGDEIAFPPDYDDYFEERVIQYGQLGLTALALANDLRNSYGIPMQDYGNWNPRAIL